MYSIRKRASALSLFKPQPAPFWATGIEGLYIDVSFCAQPQQARLVKSFLPKERQCGTQNPDARNIRKLDRFFWGGNVVLRPPQARVVLANS
jgi:hypothetical protein